MTAEFYMSDCILICIRCCLKFLLKLLLLNNDGRSVRYIAQHFLSRRVRRRQPRPENLNDLRVASEEEWAQITQDYLATLIESMPNRLRKVIRARGGNTRY
jgi:hypothetical protein